MRGWTGKKKTQSAKKSKSESGEMTPEAVAQMMTEKVAVRVLQEQNPEVVVETFFRLQDKMLHATLLVLGTLPGGAKCIAALLTVMSPVQACRCEFLR